MSTPRSPEFPGGGALSAKDAFEARLGERAQRLADPSGDRRRSRTRTVRPREAAQVFTLLACDEPPTPPKLLEKVRDDSPRPQAKSRPHAAIRAEMTS